MGVQHLDDSWLRMQVATNSLCVARVYQQVNYFWPWGSRATSWPWQQHTYSGGRVPRAFPVEACVWLRIAHARLLARVTAQPDSSRGIGPARGRAAMARAAAHATLLWLVLAAAAAAVAPSGDATRAGAVSPSLHGMLEHCSQLEDLYQSIHDGMAPWRSTGIERPLMARAIAKFTTRGGNKGIALAFRNGTAYVVEANLKLPVGHHASAFFAYMQVQRACRDSCISRAGLRNQARCQQGA